MVRLSGKEEIGSFDVNYCRERVYGSVELDVQKGPIRSAVLSACPPSSRHQLSTPFFARPAPFAGANLAGAAFLHCRLARFFSHLQHSGVPPPAPSGVDFPAVK